MYPSWPQHADYRLSSSAPNHAYAFAQRRQVSRPPRSARSTDTVLRNNDTENTKDTNSTTSDKGPSPGKKKGAYNVSNKQYECTQCGKVYKHPNCLNKHRWEHTAYWKDVSKLSLSKHSSVQLLEAASILININRESDCMSYSSSLTGLDEDLFDRKENTDEMMFTSEL
jgi:hypothetical protein